MAAFWDLLGSLARGSTVSLGSILDIRGLTVHSVIPSGRKRPSLVTPLIAGNGCLMLKVVIQRAIGRISTLISNDRSKKRSQKRLSY